MASATTPATQSAILLPFTVASGGHPPSSSYPSSVSRISHKNKIHDIVRRFAVRSGGPAAAAAVVPSPPRIDAPEPPVPEVSGDRKLAAWTSVRQDRWEGELSVEGEIPSWLNGTYLRNGPGQWHIGGHNFRHLFDGYATLVRLHFRSGHLTGGHRQLESEAYKEATAAGRVCYREFSEVPEPPSSVLGRAADLAGLLSGASLTDNANTGVVRLGDGRVVCLTETVKGTVVIDPGTLETVGRLEFQDSVGGLVHSAHPVVTEEEFLTLVPELGTAGYTVVRMRAGSSERRVVGRVRCRGAGGAAAPGWVHSFPVTRRYVVVPEMPLRYSARNLVRAEPTPLYKFEWRPETKAFVHVMCRASGRVVASVEVPLFVTFHFINAYEEEDGKGLVVDCCEHYADPAILDNLRLQKLRSLSDEDVLPDARVGRFRIPLDGKEKGELEAAMDPEQHGRGMDMCSINPSRLGLPYRFAYACGARRPCNFPNTLTKLDLVEKTAKAWHDPGSIPSEPFFIARPGSTVEDDGVVISLVSDKDGGGYAVLLDGPTFQEIARARFPYGLPYGLHGCWIPDNDINSNNTNAIHANNK